MTTLLFVLPWAASVCGAALVLRALHLPQVKPQGSDNRARILGVRLIPSFPGVVQAQGALEFEREHVRDFLGGDGALTYVGAAIIIVTRRFIYAIIRRVVRQNAHRELRPVCTSISNRVVFNRIESDARTHITAQIVTGEAEARAGSGRSKATSGGKLEAEINCVHSDPVGAPSMRDAPERIIRTTWADSLKRGSGIGRLQADTTGTELALLPTATAAEK